MKCEEFKEIKDRYLKGDLSPAKEIEAENHLNNCPDCQRLLDEALLESENIKVLQNTLSSDFYNNLDEKKQQKILRKAKYKNRFSIALFLVTIFIVLNIAGMFLSTLYFNWGEENSRLYKTQKTASLLIELTFPNVAMQINAAPFPLFTSGADWGNSSLEIKPYFTAKGYYAMQKKVGKEKYIIGDLNINQFFSFTKVSWQWQDGSFNNYLCFYHPEQLKNYNYDKGRPNGETIWQVLDTLPKGTVAEMSVSFSKTYSIEEVKALLKDYDLDITWYAVSTGLEANPEDYQAPLSAFRGVWGVPDLSSNMLNRYSPINEEDGSVREKYFLESLEYLAENEKITQEVFRGVPKFLEVSKRYEYVKENGVNVYGVVVTGPTKELLKLKDLDIVKYPCLGEVELWNWFNRNFQGEMY